MAFVIKKKDTFSWPVKFKSPADGKKYDEQEIQIEFKKLKDSEIKKLLKIEKEDQAKQFSKAVIVGWENVLTEDGSKVEFSEENLDMLLDVFGFAKAIVSTYFEIYEGSLAIAKN